MPLGGACDEADSAVFRDLELPVRFGIAGATHYGRASREAMLGQGLRQRPVPVAHPYAVDFHPCSPFG